jgi:Beta-ketoacyl synthase, N-terminal domain
MDGRGDRGESVAIIGMACRFPGARDPAEFHDLAVAGRDMFQPVATLPGRPLRAAVLDDWSAPQIADDPLTGERARVFVLRGGDRGALAGQLDVIAASAASLQALRTLDTLRAAEEPALPGRPPPGRSATAEREPGPFGNLTG